MLTTYNLQNMKNFITQLQILTFILISHSAFGQETLPIKDSTHYSLLIDVLEFNDLHEDYRNLLDRYTDSAKNAEKSIAVIRILNDNEEEWDFSKKIPDMTLVDLYLVSEYDYFGAKSPGLATIGPFSIFGIYYYKGFTLFVHIKDSWRANVSNVKFKKELVNFEKKAFQGERTFKWNLIRCFGSWFKLFDI